MQLAKSHDGKRVFIIVTSTVAVTVSKRAYLRAAHCKTELYSLVPYNWWCSLTVVTMSTNNNGYFHSVARAGRLTIKCENRYQRLQRLRSLTSRTRFISARFSFIDFALPAYYCCHVCNKNFPSLYTRMHSNIFFYLRLFITCINLLFNIRAIYILIMSFLLINEIMSFLLINKIFWKKLQIFKDSLNL